MKKQLLFLSVCLALILLSVACTACSKPVGLALPKKYRPLSSAEVGDFAAKKGIDILAVRNIDEATIILCETESQVGDYALAIDEQGKLFESGTFTNSNKASDNPVNIMAGGAGVHYVTVIINDPALLQQAYMIVVQLSNRDELSEEVNGKEAHIIVNDGRKDADVQFESLLILDKDENQIYEHDRTQ